MNSNEINNHTSGQRETLAEKAARLNQKAGPDREFHDDDPVGKPAKSRKPVKGVRYEDIDPTIDLDALTWSWRNRIPRGLCLLTGREGAGKSGATDWLAYHYSTGATWPDGQPCEANSFKKFSWFRQCSFTQSK